MRRRPEQRGLKNRIKNRRVAAAAVRAERRSLPLLRPPQSPPKVAHQSGRFPLLRHSSVRHAHPCFSQNIVIRSFGDLSDGWRADYVASHGFVETHYEGVLSREDLGAAIERTLALSREQRHDAVLGDCSRLEGGHDIFTLYGFVRLLESLGWSVASKKR